jgi:hypothetical protein
MGTILQEDDEASRFSKRLFVRCPPALPAAVDIAARRALMSPSEYVRRSIIDRLKADGIDPMFFASPKS